MGRYCDPELGVPVIAADASVFSVNKAVTTNYTTPLPLQSPSWIKVDEVVRVDFEFNVIFLSNIFKNYNTV